MNRNTKHYRNQPQVHSLFELGQAETGMQFLQPSACTPTRYIANEER